MLTGSLILGDSLPLALDRAVQFVTLAIRATFGLDMPTREGILLERALPALRAPLSGCVCELVSSSASSSSSTSASAAS